MKTTLLIICLFILGTVHSQTSGLLLNDNFSYSTGSLGTQNGWIQTGSNHDIQVANTTPLSFAGYTGGGSYLVSGGLMTSGSYDGKDPFKPFSSNLSTNSPSFSVDKVVFYSFLVNVQTPRRNGSNVDYLLSLRTNDGKQTGHFYVKSSSVNTAKINFGIYTKNETDSTKVKWTRTEYDKNQVYLVTIRYDFRSGSDDDRMYLWVNPALSSSDPSISSANATVTAGQEDYSGGATLSSLQLHQESYASHVFFDGFRLAYGGANTSTAANATEAWNKAGMGPTPIPVKFQSFTAMEKTSGVELYWSTSEEVNASHYEVERSYDGINFKFLSSVNAKGNSTTLVEYGFTDISFANAICHYRIRQVDLDGRYAYTPVRTVHLNNNGKGIDIRGNNGRIVMNFSTKATNVSVRVISLSGQVISEFRIANAMGQVILNAPVKGHYVISLSNGSTISTAAQVML